MNSVFEPNTKNYAYRVEGGQPVVGEINCLGAKNFLTKAMVAALLGNTPTKLTNVTNMGDVEITKYMLTSINVKVDLTFDGTMTIDPANLDLSSVALPPSGANRIPILLLGALLHRFEEVEVPVLGGCLIGERKVDFHLEIIKQFGGHVEQTEEKFLAKRTKQLVGSQIELPYPSVGATETCLYLGVLAKGTTVISNVAVEPEILELVAMLQSMGAIIYVFPELREFRIEGVKELSGTQVPVMGDRIDAASWACMACATDGDIVVHGINREHLGNFFPYFQQVGGGFTFIETNSIRFFRKSSLKPAIVETDVYPSFSTDLQQPFAVLLTQAEGVSIIHETVYENRFAYLNSLNQLGAKTQLESHCLGSTPCRFRNSGHKHSAIIVGGTPLICADRIDVSDLRAGLACVIAAAVASGMTMITNIHHIERGYGKLDERISNLNFSIEKVLLQ
jgi:UDP-N-acetylglucosamine 1-carboxyvinyltransferase